MPRFHAPYNFIPVTGKINNTETPKTSWESLATEANINVRHDYWASGTHSGRIVCKLTLETPTVVGCKQTGPDGSTKLVEQYHLNGKPAIPASSLRGMVSSVAEALSQSAMRVLDNQSMSVRKPMDKAISSIGILHSENDCLELVPLVTGPIQSNTQTFALDSLLKAVITQKAGRERTWRQILPAYLYTTNFNHQGKLIVEPGVAEERAVDAVSFNADEPVYYYAKLRGSPTSVEQSLDVSTQRSDYKIKEPQGNLGGFMLLGQTIDGNIITENRFKELVVSEQSKYSRGVLFIFGKAGRDLPRNKKHDYFVPYPDDSNDYAICLPEDVLESYAAIRQLVRQSDQTNKLPYELAGYPDSELKHGRMCRFGLRNNVAQHIEVGEISYSAIWRKKVDGSIHDFFKQIGVDVLPWNPQRNNLTQAELLFGVVDDGKSAEKTSRNLASRVRFSDAQSETEVKLMPEVTLKILSSPRLPTPAMYFQPKNGVAAIRKVRLNLTDHKPRGRKVYLPHTAEQIQQQCWVTADSQVNSQQKLRVTPMPPTSPGSEFWFHVDFENLSDSELNLLRYSLSLGEKFRHRLGLGKPLGLGVVSVSRVGVFFVDRVKRYADFAIDTPRYSAFMGVAGSALPQRYAAENIALNNRAIPIKPTDGTKWLDAYSYLRLLAVTNRDNLEHPVCYPYQDGQDGETEGFKWFMRNERTNPPAQALEEIPISQKQGDISIQPKLPSLHT